MRQASGAQSQGDSRGTKEEPSPAAGRGWGQGIAARSPQSRTMPQHGRRRAGGAGWRWRPQPTRGPPTDRQLTGGHSPGAPGRRRGKLGQVKRREDRSRRRVQRKGLSGFPAQGVVREAGYGRRGAPCFSGHGRRSRRPNGRPGVQPGERPCCPLAATRPFVARVHPPP